MYLLKYHELPAQPGIVFSSNGNTVLWSILSFDTTLLSDVSQDQKSEFPSGGYPSSVGK